MPTTNDVNEGALGQFQVMMRRQPQLTLLQYNARTMYGCNKTAEFMKEKFDEDTLKYIQEVSREREILLKRTESGRLSNMLKIILLKRRLLKKSVQSMQSKKLPAFLRQNLNLTRRKKGQS